MKKLEIKVFVDVSAQEAEKSIRHLNQCTNTDFYFKREIIPVDAYYFEQNKLTFAVDYLLSKLTIIGSSDPPVIIVTDRSAEYNTQLFSDKNILLISTFQGTHSYQKIAVLIYSATLELTDNFKKRGLTAKFFQDFSDGYSELDSDTKKIFATISRNELLDFHVLITHGIRTHCSWAETSQKELKSSFGISSTVIRYGFINLLKFILSKSVQTKLGHDLLVKLIHIEEQNNGISLGIITHSYSSLLIGKALELADQLKINIEIEAIIMNGSILPQNFDWSRFVNKEKKTGVRVKRILNICGDQDIWPVFASHFAPEAGSSGAFFFSENSSQILNLRFKDCGHSGMLLREFARDYWGKFITDDNFSPENEVSSPSCLVKRFDYILSNFLPLIFAAAVLLSFIIITCLSG
jgi:hypothetical protein